MAFTFLYLAVRALLGARSRRGLHVKDVELLVLRDELEILRRQVDAAETSACRSGAASGGGLPPATGVWPAWTAEAAA